MLSLQTPQDLVFALRLIRACATARNRVPSGVTPEEAWASWSAASELVWVAARVGVDPSVVRAAVLECLSRVADACGEPDAPAVVMALRAGLLGESSAEDTQARVQGYCVTHPSALAWSLEELIPLLYGACRTTEGDVLHDALVLPSATRGTEAFADVVRGMIPFQKVAEAYATFTLDADG